MADQWAIYASSAMILLSLAIIGFHLVPIQVRLLFTHKDWLDGYRLRLLLVSTFIFASAAPVLMNRLLREFGIQSALLSDVAALAVGSCFLGFAISLVSLYYYDKDKE